MYSHKPEDKILMGQIMYEFSKVARTPTAAATQLTPSDRRSMVESPYANDAFARLLRRPLLPSLNHRNIDPEKKDLFYDSSSDSSSSGSSQESETKKSGKFEQIQYA